MSSFSSLLDPVSHTMSYCRTRECELGNIAADAMLAEFRTNDKSVVCALCGSGTIKLVIVNREMMYWIKII